MARAEEVSGNVLQVFLGFLGRGAASANTVVLAVAVGETMSKHGL